MASRLVLLPGFLWLLLPPICICHLPEQLLGLPYYEAPWQPGTMPEEEDHAPGCPAAKKFTPQEAHDWHEDLPVVESLVETLPPLPATDSLASDSSFQVSQQLSVSSPPPHGYPSCIYISLHAMRL